MFNTKIAEGSKSGPTTTLVPFLLIFIPLLLVLFCHESFFSSSSRIPLQISVSLLYIVEQRSLGFQVGDGRVGRGHRAFFGCVVTPAIQSKEEWEKERK